jgi:hypothetical protein
MKQNHRRLSSVLAACVLLLTVCAEAERPVNKPFYAHGISTGVLDLTYFDPFDPSSWVCDFWSAGGTGEATHLGRYDSSGVHTINLVTQEMTGECILTTIAGTQLRAKPTPVSEDIMWYDITGGSGPFEHATGSFIETSVTLSEEPVIFADDAGPGTTG